jgi:hypothetical protein
MTPFASLPMYNFPEMRSANAQFWGALRGLLLEAGLKANILGVLAVAAPIEGAYTTPFATVIGPVSTAPLGSGVCHRISPVVGSRALHEPAVPTPVPAVYCR